MKFFRNPEIYRYTILSVSAALLFSAAGRVFAWGNPFYIFGISMVFLALFLILTYRRYKDLERISRDMDAVLSGKREINFSAYSEGELSLLQNQMTKIVSRLNQQADQLKEEKGTLADAMADISHQLRTPLTSMNLLLDLLKDPELSQEKRKDYIQQLIRLVNRVEWLVTALLKTSKLEAGSIQLRRDEITLEELYNRAVQPLLIPLEIRNIQMDVKLAGSFCGDLIWSAEALGNILKNCLEHTPENGRIRIRGRENAIMTELVIADNGPGFHAEDIPHLFERFYRGQDASEQSIGIGLALARAIIKNEQGTIRAANASEGGAEFSIRFYKSVL